jgi:hypothetical protein
LDSSMAFNIISLRLNDSFFKSNDLLSILLMSRIAGMKI